MQVKQTAEEMPASIGSQIWRKLIARPDAAFHVIERRILCSEAVGELAGIFNGRGE